MVVKLKNQKYTPERFHSLIIGSMSPYKRPKAERDQQIKEWLQGGEAIIAAREREGSPLTQQEKASLLENDNFASAASLTAARDYPDLSDVPPMMTMPCLAYAGELDLFWLSGQKECVKQMPNVTFFTLPGIDHQGAFHHKLCCRNR